MQSPYIPIFLVAVLSLACASPSHSVWTSVPPVQEASAPAYEIKVEPVKRDEPFYVAFQLEIQNRGTRPLEVDWDNTRYFHKGEDLGVLLFSGIDPKTVKSGIPSDTIPAGESFKKEIFPLRTIAPLPRDQLPEPGRRGFEPGPLPAGSNGIRLALRQDGRQLQETFQIKLVNEKQAG